MLISLVEFLKVSALRSCANDDVTRPHQCGVSFDLVKHIGCATNGHILAESKPIGVIEGSADDPKRVLLPIDMLRACEKVSRKLRGCYEVELKVASALLRGPGHEQGWKLETSLADMYPRVEQLWPRDDKEKGSVVKFNADYLVRVADAVRGDSQGVNVTFYDPMSPILVEGLSGRGLVMPMRL